MNFVKDRTPEAPVENTLRWDHADTSLFCRRTFVEYSYAVNMLNEVYEELLSYDSSYSHRIKLILYSV